MPDDTELTPETIATAAAEPAEAEKDGQRAKAHPIPDQIEAAKFAAANATDANGKKPKIRTRRVVTRDD